MMKTGKWMLGFIVAWGSLSGPAKATSRPSLPAPVSIAVQTPPVQAIPGTSTTDKTSQRENLHHSNPEIAYAAAWELGKQEDAPGLEEILGISPAGRRSSLMTLYRLGLEWRKEDQPLPRAIEQIILKNRQDPELMDELVKLLGQRPYGSQELFDYLYEKKWVLDKAIHASEPSVLMAFLKTRENQKTSAGNIRSQPQISGYGLKAQPRYAQIMPLVNTRLQGMEPRLARLLPELDEKLREKLYQHLLSKAYPPAIAEFQKKFLDTGLCSSDRYPFYRQLQYLPPAIASQLLDQKLAAYWQAPEKLSNAACITYHLEYARRHSLFDGQDGLYCGHWDYVDDPSFKIAYLKFLGHVKSKACLKDLAMGLADSKEPVRSMAYQAARNYSELTDLAAILALYHQARPDDDQRSGLIQPMDRALTPLLAELRHKRNAELLTLLREGAGDQALAAAWVLGQQNDAPALKWLVANKDDTQRTRQLALYLESSLRDRNKELGRQQLTHQNRRPTLPLKPEIESILVENLHDPSLRWLNKLAGKRQYASRELTEYFLKQRNTRQLLLSTDDTAYPKLLALLPRLDFIDQLPVIYELEQRRYLPVKDYIASLAASRPVCSPDQPRVVSLLRALPQEQAAGLLARKLEQLWLQPGDADGKCAAPLLKSAGRYAAHLPKTPDLYCDHASFSPSPEFKQPYLKLLGKLKLPECLPDLYRLLDDQDTSVRDEARFALLAYDTPESWKTILKDLQALYDAQRLSKDRYTFLKMTLEQRLSHQDQYLAGIAREQQTRAFQREYHALATRMPSPRELMHHAEPEKLHAWKHYLRQLSDLTRDYPGLSTANNALNTALEWEKTRLLHLRFDEKSPQQAANDLQELLAVLPEHAPEQKAYFAYYLGDLYQYDLDDKSQAVDAYTQALESAGKSPGNEDDNPFTLGWLTSWLNMEIRFLRTGKPLDRRLTVEEQMRCGTMIYSAYLSQPQEMALTKKLHELDMKNRSPAPVDRQAYRQLLQQLPASHLFFMTALERLPLIKDPKYSLDLLQRLDPGRYWSSCFLGMLKQRPELAAGINPRTDWTDLDQTLALFQEKTGLDLETATDYALASPMETWRLFRRSILLGETGIARSCLAEDALKDLGESLSKWSPDQRRQFYKDWKNFSATRQTEQEAQGTLFVSSSGSRYLIDFHKRQGQWKITGFRIVSRPDLSFPISR
ncbi:hypothetical protein [Thiolapillus brandeum]|nr:hypothetical protein [Thiolapillus brandeum]